jgi:predicted amidohydrolase
MRVALCQRASTITDTKANLAQVLADLDEHGPSSDLVLFPELFLGGYNVGDAHHDLALDLEGPVLDELAQAARDHDTAVVVGGARASETRGLTHNSAFVLTPGGDHHAYDKVHLPTFNVFEEGLHFTPGDRGLIVELDDVTLGIAICYDLFFPEITKDLARSGADVIATISASPVTSTPYFDTVLPARALETTSFVAYCNLVGVQDGLAFGGGSQAISPLGDELVHAPKREEAVVTCEFDVDDVDLARKKRPVLRDTRMFPHGEAREGEPWPTTRDERDRAED